MKIVVLDFGNGSLNEGFAVTLRISKDDRYFIVEDRGITLPPAPEIGTTYKTWQDVYTCQGEIISRRRIKGVDVRIVSSRQECIDAADLFLDKFNQWLNSPEFWRSREEIARNIRLNEPIRIVIQTQDPLLRRLPWHEWNLLETYRQGEIVLHGSESKSKRHRCGKMRILAVFGSNEGIDIQKDRDILKKLLPDAEIVYLPHSNQKLKYQDVFDALCDRKGWDIFFFAGHSISEENDKIGRIYLDSQDESITIDELKNALRRSLEKGLQLAIFNSCDGLGLAHQLAAVEIPNVVVMREPLPDKVAHDFLKNLLENLKECETLNLAVRHAREQLQSVERENPCATWLPAISQHPKSKDFKYRQFPKIVRVIQKTIRKKIWILVISLAILTSILLSDRQSSFSQRFSQGDKILFLDTNNSDKQHGVNSFSRKDYRKAIESFKQSLKQNSDDPETKIYLNNAIIGERNTITIAVVVSAGKNPDIAKEILRGIAQKQEEINSKKGIKDKYLKIEIVNDDNEGEIAKKVAEELVKDEEVIAVIGHNSSNASIEAVEIYKNKLVAITATTTANALTSENQDGYVYRTVLTSQVFGEHLGDYAQENYQKVLVCKDSRAKDQSFMKAFKDTIGKDKIASIDCDLNQNETPETIVQKAKDKNIDAIFISPYLSNISQALDLAKIIDKKRIKLLGNISFNSSITSSRGLDAVGMVTVAPWNPNNLNINNKKFLKESKKLWQTTVTTTWRSATSYDALGVITEAIQQGNNSRNGIQKALANPSFLYQGITGTIAFSSNGDRLEKDNAQPVLQQLRCIDLKSPCFFETIDKQFNRHSLGEKILFKELNNPLKERAVESFAEGKYTETIEQFNTYLSKNPQDPEARVYLNNAKAALAKGQLRLAVPLPISSNPEVAAEMLRGVAQVQEEIVSQGGINGKLLELKIFNDENKEEIAHKLAQEIVKDPTILAVIGHNASNASIAASKIYDFNGLVMITPTSFAEALDNSSKGNIFRMTTNISLFVDRLADYILQASPQAKVVICYDEDAPDNTPFKTAFQDRLQPKPGNYIDLDCQLNAPNFAPDKKIEEIIASGADTILFTPYIDRLNLAIALATANRGRLKLLGTPTLYTSQTLEKGKEAVKGLTVIVPWFPDTSFDRAFPDKAKQLWKMTVGWRTANSYDTANTIVAALKQHPQREGLNKTIRKLNSTYTGVTGKVEFASDGSRNFLPSTVAIIQVIPDVKSSSGFSFRRLF